MTESDARNEALGNDPESRGDPRRAPGARGGETANEGEGELSIPREIALLPLRNTVVFPLSILPVVVGRKRSIQLVDEEVAAGHLIGAVTQRSPDVTDPTEEDLYGVGCGASVGKLVRLAKDNLNILLQGIFRFRIQRIVKTDPYLVAEIEPIEDRITDAATAEALRRTATNLFMQAISARGEIPSELAQALSSPQNPGLIADLVAANFPLETAQKQELLELGEVEERLRRVITYLNRELQVTEIRQQIEKKAGAELDRRGREALLREQLRAIQQELGDTEEGASATQDLRERVINAKMSPEAEKAALKEVDRLSTMPQASPEFTVARSYVDWLVALPWSVSTEDNLDIARAREILEEDHFGLEKVKERILELIAVLKLRRDHKGPVLCLVGPPGVGKTSLGRSIGRALNRNFVRISLGGVRDEAEIRGHRRTYIGALPGRIIQAMRKAGSNNPVFLLDEIDKVGADFRGDPSAALLEVLDPAQNSTFSDHYLEVTFDLSKVLFIATANQLEPIPAALLDRMEVIRVSGYTDEEKLHIAKRHLIPKLASESGLPEGQLTLPDQTVLSVAQDYTRESGVRNLERTLERIFRKVARKHAENGGGPITVAPEDLREYLGPRRFFREAAEETSVPGVATGLAWTPTGGEVLFIEATRMEGSGNLILTGQLGDVMKESARIAMSCIRSRAERLGIDSTVFGRSEVHLHVPAGAVPKDGPSAGITLAVALASLFSGRLVRGDLAMTGELTLRGRVMPVGGIKEKVLGALRAEIKTVILPRGNQGDVEEVERDLHGRINIILVDSLDQVLELALQERGASPEPDPAAVAAGRNSTPTGTENSEV